MKQSRTTFFLIVFSTLIFSCLSYYYISNANNLGSNEASALLTKKTSIINWEKFQRGSSQSSAELVDEDTFLNYSHSPALALRENTKAKPSLYVRTTSQIYPIFVQTRTGALPHFLTGVFSRWLRADIGLTILPIILSITCFFISLLIVARNQRLIVPFLLIALTAPQFIYFLNPFFPDSYSSFSVIICVLFLFETGVKKRTFYLIGFLLALALYFKISSLTLFPLFFIFYPKKILKNFKNIIFGTLPIVLFFILTFSFKDFYYLLSEERTFLKHAQFNFDVIKYFSLYNFVPSISFTQIVSLNPVFPQTNVSQDAFTISIYMAHAVSFLLFFTNFIRLQDLIKIVSFLVIYIITTCALVSGINEDLIDFMAQGIYLFILLLFIHINPLKVINRKKLFLALLSFLFITRVIIFWLWSNEFSIYKKQFVGCIWAYDCMVKDWKKNDILKEKQLITLYYLDVGQVEYFSQESITPLHVNWKYSKIPAREDFLDFLVHYPAQDFFILSSKELGVPTDLSLYLGVHESKLENFLQLYNIKMELVKRYNYPGISREYSLIKLSKI